jgi:hypothetical protein
MHDQKKKPAGLDDATGVVEDEHGPLPAGQYVQRVRRFLNQTRRRAPIKQSALSLSREQASEKTTASAGTTKGAAYLDRVDDGVEDGGEGAAADAHLRLRLQVLEPHLDGGHVDPDPAPEKQNARTNSQTPAAGEGGLTDRLLQLESFEHSPVDAVLELEQEPLIVLVGDAHEAFQQRPALAGAEAEHVDVHDALTPGRRCLVTAETDRDDGAADAVVGGEPLERRPQQRILVVVVPAPPQGPAVPEPHARHLLDFPRRVHLPGARQATSDSELFPPLVRFSGGAATPVSPGGCEDRMGFM